MSANLEFAIQARIIPTIPNKNFLEYLDGTLRSSDAQFSVLSLEHGFWNPVAEAF